MENLDSALPSFEDCAKQIRAIDDTMDILNGKWKVSILARLLYRPMRYSELLKHVKGISGRMLSMELQDLEANEIIKRIVADTKPPSVTYEVSPYGQTLKVLTDTIAHWGINHRKRMVSSIRLK